MKKGIFLVAFMILASVAFASEQVIPIVLAEQTAWINTIANAGNIPVKTVEGIMAFLDNHLTKDTVVKKTIKDEEGAIIEEILFHVVWTPTVKVIRTQITTVELNRQIAVAQEELDAIQAKLDALIAQKQALIDAIPAATEE